MKTNKNGNKVFLVVFLVVGMFFLIPVMFMLFIDGFTGFIFVPFIMFAVMGIAFLFIFKVARKNFDTVNNNRKFQKDVDRHCIYCHESIEAYHKFCPLCGVEQTEYIICDYCGHQNDKHNLQCEKCNALIK